MEITRRSSTLMALALAAALAGPAVAGAAVTADERARVVEAFGRLPLAFEENRGQTDARVRFLSRGPGYALFLTGDEAVLALRQGGADGPLPGSRRAAAALAASARPTAVVRLRFEGARRAELEGRESQAGESHYLSLAAPERAVTGVPRFGRVLARGVYPGIDVAWYGKEGSLEYDLLVAPGADPGAVRLRVEGADALALDGAGGLVVAVGGRELVQRAPVAYQEIGGARRPVASRYRLDAAAGVVTFEVGAYDRDRPLVVDPVIAYSTYLGGNADEYAWGVAVTPNGQAHVAGWTQSTNFPTTAGVVQPNDVDGTGFDAFVTKLNLDGTAIGWSTYLGLGGYQSAWNLGIDASRNVYVVGVTKQVDPDGDAFIVKLDATGSTALYSVTVGGSENDDFVDVAVDADGNAYTVGFSCSPDFPTTSGVAQPWYGGDCDAIVAKFNRFGARLWSTYLGGPWIDTGNGLAVDPLRRVYVCGRVDLPSGTDAYVKRLNEAGSVVEYEKLFGGSGWDEAEAVAVNGAFSAFIAGDTTSPNLPTTPGSAQPLPGGGLDLFVAKLDAQGRSFVYLTYFGNAAGQSAWDVTLDGADHAIVAGSTSAIDPLGDALVLKLNQAGSGFLAQTRLGGNDTENATSVAMDQYGNIYVVGPTRSTNYPTTLFTDRIGWDVFVTKLQP